MRERGRATCEHAKQRRQCRRRARERARATSARCRERSLRESDWRRGWGLHCGNIVTHFSVFYDSLAPYTPDATGGTYCKTYFFHNLPNPLESTFYLTTTLENLKIENIWFHCTSRLPQRWRSGAREFDNLSEQKSSRTFRLPHRSGVVARELGIGTICFCCF